MMINPAFFMFRCPLFKKHNLMVDIIRKCTYVSIVGQLNYWWRHHDVTWRHRVGCRIFWPWIVPPFNFDIPPSLKFNGWVLGKIWKIRFLAPFPWFSYPRPLNRWRHNPRFFPKCAKYIFSWYFHIKSQMKSFKPLQMPFSGLRYNTPRNMEI